MYLNGHVETRGSAVNTQRTNAGPKFVRHGPKQEPRALLQPRCATRRYPALATPFTALLLLLYANPSSRPTLLHSAGGTGFLCPFPWAPVRRMQLRGLGHLTRTLWCLASPTPASTLPCNDTLSTRSSLSTSTNSRSSNISNSTSIHKPDTRLPSSPSGTSMHDHCIGEEGKE